MPTASARPRRAAPKETIVLRATPANKKKLLALVKVLHLAEVETLDQKIVRFQQSASAQVPLSDEEITELVAEEIRAVRAARRDAR